MNYNYSKRHPSSENQWQLAGATRFSRTKVYDKNGRASWRLLSPNEFQKCLKSCSLIGQKNFLSNQKVGFQTDASGTRSVRVNAQGLTRSCCKLSPVKISSPQLAAPRSPRMSGTSIIPEAFPCGPCLIGRGMTNKSMTN